MRDASSPGSPERAWETLRRVCQAGAGDPVSPLSLLAADEGPLLELLNQHGLAGILYGARGSLASGAGSTPLLAACREAFLAETARNALLDRQLRQIAGAFAARGVPLIALKGAVALATLYPGRGLRPASDLDLLIREGSVEPARRIMEDLGYAAAPAYTSPQEERVHTARSHISPYLKPGHLPVELHLSILQGKGRPERATPEVWAGALRLDANAPTVDRLAPPHFLLHAASHYMNHLEQSAAPLIWLVDLLLATRKWGGSMDWEAFWSTAARWGIQGKAAVVMATLNRYWAAGVPLVPGGATPVSPGAMVTSPARRRMKDPGRFTERLRLARDFPDAASSGGYLWHLFFPTAAHLRYRFQVPQGASLAPYYLRYLAGYTGRLCESLLALARERLKADRERER